MIPLHHCQADPDKELTISWIAIKYQKIIAPWIHLQDTIRVIQNQKDMILKTKTGSTLAINEELAQHIGIQEN